MTETDTKTTGTDTKTTGARATRATPPARPRPRAASRPGASGAKARRRAARAQQGALAAAAGPALTTCRATNHISVTLPGHDAAPRRGAGHADRHGGPASLPRRIGEHQQATATRQAGPAQAA
jgi:hypothetical protein